MDLLAIFCTNAINIYAGINGLEVGQSIVIAIAITIHNAIEINKKSDVWMMDDVDDGSSTGRMHLFSNFMMSPFLGTSFGLFR